MTNEEKKELAALLKAKLELERKLITIQAETVAIKAKTKRR